MEKVYVVMERFEGEENYSFDGSRWEITELIDVFEKHEDAVDFVKMSAQTAALNIMKSYSEDRGDFKYYEWVDGISTIDPDEEVYTYLHFETEDEISNRTYIIKTKYLR